MFFVCVFLQKLAMTYASGALRQTIKNVWPYIVLFVLSITILAHMSWFLMKTTLYFIGL